MSALFDREALLKDRQNPLVRGGKYYPRIAESVGLSLEAGGLNHSRRGHRPRLAFEIRFRPGRAFQRVARFGYASVAPRIERPHSFLHEGTTLVAEEGDSACTMGLPGPNPAEPGVPVYHRGWRGGPRPYSMGLIPGLEARQHDFRMPLQGER